MLHFVSVKSYKSWCIKKNREVHDLQLLGAHGYHKTLCKNQYMQKMDIEKFLSSKADGQHRKETRIKPCRLLGLRGNLKMMFWMLVYKLTRSSEKVNVMF